MGWAVAKAVSKQPAPSRAQPPRRRQPEIFNPPISGGGYYGRFYRFEQALHNTNASFMAIQAWIAEIAGGEDPKIGRKRPKGSVKGKAIRKSLSPHHEFEPLEEGDPLLRSFEEPNVWDVPFDLWQYHTLFDQLQGIVYWWVRRNAFGIPYEYWIIPPHWCQLMTGPNGDPAYYWVQAPWGHILDIPFDEVVTFASPSPLNPRWEGWAVSQAIGQIIDSYESMLRSRVAVWESGAVPAFHVSLGEAYMDPDDSFLGRFYGKWLSRFQGPNNSGRPLITGADVEVKGIDGHRPADALQASNDSEKQMRDLTFAAYGVPSAIMGLTEGMTYGSVEASKAAFREYRVDAKLKHMGQVITHKIVRKTPGYEDGIFFWDKRATGDPEFTLRQQESRLKTGCMSVNEVRTEDGLEAWPHGGDNPTLDGQEMPWMTGEVSDQPLAAAFNQAMNGQPMLGNPNGRQPTASPEAVGHNGNGESQLRTPPQLNGKPH